MNRTLFAKELRANLFVSLIIAAVLAMYIGVIVSMYDPELGESLDAMMQSMPEMFAAFGMSVQATTLIDFMLNYLYGFLLTIFILVLILIVANKLMVRYLDRGAMAYLLATPNSRTRIALTMVGVMVTILVALMAVVTALEAGFAEALFSGELDMQALMQVNAGLLALWLAMAGLCFLSACLFSNATAALWVGGGLNILFFLMQMISQVGDKFEFLKNVNPLTLFDYYGLAAGDASAVGGAIALAVGAVALFAVAVAAFDRRDLRCRRTDPAARARRGCPRPRGPLSSRRVRTALRYAAAWAARFRLGRACRWFPVPPCPCDGARRRLACVGIATIGRWRSWAFTPLEGRWLARLAGARIGLSLTWRTPS